MDEHAPAEPASSLRRELTALGILALLFIAFFFRAVPLGLDPVRSTNAPAQFDTGRAIDRLARILDGEPHPVDSPALDATRARLLAEITALGYTPEVHDQTACRGSISGSAIRCARVQNITFTAGPPTGAALVLTAHYDSVEASPGFGDDGLGVAVWLEVAKHFADQPPAKPVLFLLTDGEETALLGAQAFADAKGYGREIGNIINLEARGVRGPAMMFETSHPNQGVVSAWAKNGARPFSNSMMTAVYELLPNSTDLTVYLRNGWTGINIAISDGLDFYHSHHDDLAHLSRASVQHMGDQALGAARAFLTTDTSSRGEIVYSDIGSRLFVMLPQVFGLVLLGLCFGLSAMLVMRPAKDISWRNLDMRALGFAPALVLIAGLVAWAMQMLIGAARPEPYFWTAHPQALNVVIFLSTLIVAALGLAFLAPHARREALFASGWFWFLAVGVGLSIAVPGMAIIFLMPGLVFVACAVAAWLAPRYLVVAHAVAAAAIAFLFFPLIHLVDVMMGLGMAAMFGVLEGLVLATMIGLIAPFGFGRRALFPALGAAWVIAVVTTLVLPAFSAERPLTLNLTAHFDTNVRKALLVASSPPAALPKDIRAMLPDAAADLLPGVSTTLAYATLGYADLPQAALTVETDTSTAEARTLTFVMSAPGARMIRVRIPASAAPTGLLLDGAPAMIAMREPQNGAYIFDCVGATCDGARLTLTTAPKQATTDANTFVPDPWIVQGYWNGLPADAQPVAALRTDAALQAHFGDSTIVTTRFAP
jgi:hypothetical protein